MKIQEAHGNCYKFVTLKTVIHITLPSFHCSTKTSTCLFFSMLCIFVYWLYFNCYSTCRSLTCTGKGSLYNSYLCLCQHPECLLVWNDVIILCLLHIIKVLDMTLVWNDVLRDNIMFASHHKSVRIALMTGLYVHNHALYSIASLIFNDCTLIT